MSFLRLEIFKSSQNKKFEFPSSKNPGYFAVSGSGECDDWCSIGIGEITPIIKDIHVSQRGCVLSRAATNSIVEAIENKTAYEAKDILVAFTDMLNNKSNFFPLSDKLLIFKKFSKFPSRRACLLVGCNLLLKILNESGF